VVTNLHADAIGEGRGDSHRQDDAFKSICMLGSLAIDEGDIQGIPVNTKFGDALHQRGRDAVCPKPRTITKPHTPQPLL
jgi:hypothetical protein